MTTITLYQGQTLMVTADGVSRGRVYRRAFPGMAQIDENHAVASSATVELGPYMSPRIYDIVDEVGYLQYAVLVKDSRMAALTEAWDLDMPGPDDQPIASYVDPYTPDDGATLHFRDNRQDGTIFIDDISVTSLTIDLPTDATSRIGQLLTIGSAGYVDTLVITGGTIFGALESLSPGDSATYQKVKSNTWMRRP